jgi:predicted nuclease of predicted toxin-antitoxin system
VKFLIDSSLSPTIAKGLKQAGHDAVHLRSYGMQAASDAEVFKFAVEQDRILISADTDFGTLLALWHDIEPSVILLHHPQKSPQSQLALLLANLPAIEEALEHGGIVILEATRIRIRSLPIGGDINESQ